MTTIQSPNGQTTSPRQVTAGSLITVNPGVGATATMEYTLASRTDILNRVAVWTVWPKGAVTSSTQDLVGETLHVRSTSIGGADSSYDTEPNPSPQQLQAYKTAFGIGGTTSSSVSANQIIVAPLNTIPNIGSFNLASNFARSRAKKALVASGLGSMKTAFLGDSTEAGIYALGTADPTTGVKKFSPCSRMAALINSTTYPANSDSAWCDNNSGAVQAYDPRVFFNSGVTSSTTIRSIAGWITTTASNPLYFTPRNFADTVDLYYIDNNVTFNLSRVGDVTGPLVTGGNTGAVMKATLTFSTRTVTAAFAAKPASGTLLIVGIVCYDSTKPCVQCFNWGWSGGAAADWASTTNLYSVANAVAAVAPDLTFFTPGINDWSNNTGVPAFEANIDFVVKKLLLSGDVVLSTSVPSQNSAYPLANQKLYVDAIIRVAAANPGVMLNDSWGRWRTWEEQNDFGFYTNNLHPNVAGYLEKGQGYARIFTSI